MYRLRNGDGDGDRESKLKSIATTTQLSADQYLKMHFEDLEPEFVHGELIERIASNFAHGWIQTLSSVRLRNAGYAVLNISLRIAADVIRIADVALFSRLPKEDVPTQPPLVVIEIASPDDRHIEVLRKLEEYRIWGVEHIWVVEPDIQKFHIYESRGLIEAKQFELPELDIRIDANELFAEAIAP